MSGQRGTEKRTMQNVFTFRTDDGLAAAIEAAMASAGLSEPAWLREAAAAHAGMAAADLRPSRRRVKEPAPEHILRMVALQETTAELTGALVQAAIRTRQAGREADHAAIEATIPEVRATAQALTRLIREMDPRS